MRAQVVILLLLCIAYAFACNTNTFRAGTRAFTRCQALKAPYDVYWNVEGQEVVFALHLRIPGVWVGLGISVNGGMKGADIVVAQFVNGSITLEDRYATQYARPQLDQEQNVKFLDSFYDETQTIVVYSRRIKPCDIQEDVPILEDATQVIFAWGSTPALGYHGNQNRGTTTVYFFYEHEAAVLPSDTQTFEIRTPAYEVPSKLTTYTCTSHELPHDQKYHIVKWTPIVDGSYIHHIALFGCLRNPNTPTPYECPMNPGVCSDLMFAWSLGQPGQEWMGEYALPIGGTAFAYAVMQIHYNNVAGTAGMIDTSGFTVSYSTQLRPQDMASLAISYTVAAVFVPARAPAVKYVAECPRECTQRKVPARGVTLIYWFPHMHQVGQKMWLQHIRDGVELPEIGRDDHYDFGKQQTYAVNTTLLPGDTLRIHCEYNATLKDTDTTGGEGSSQEMCVGMLQYFPAVPLFPRCRRDFYPVPEVEANCGDNRLPNGTFPTTPVVPFNFTTLPPAVTPCVPERPCVTNFTQSKVNGWVSGSQAWTQWLVTVVVGDRDLYSAEIQVTTTATTFTPWNINLVPGSTNVYTIPQWQYINGVIPANSRYITFGYTISSATKADFSLKNNACVPKACPLAVSPVIRNSWIFAGTTYQDVYLNVINTGTSPVANVKLEFDFYGGARLLSSYNLSPAFHNPAETSKNFTCALWNLQPGQSSNSCGYILAIPTLLTVNLDVSIAQAVCL